MGDHHHVVAFPGGWYQMAVYHQDVEHLFPERGVCSQLALSQPGDNISGRHVAVFLGHLLAFLPEHRDGLVGQAGGLLRGGLNRVGPDQLYVQPDFPVIVDPDLRSGSRPYRPPQRPKEPAR